jgi:hypothetical protein
MKSEEDEEEKSKLRDASAAAFHRCRRRHLNGRRENFKEQIFARISM